VSRQQELRPSQRQGALVGKWRYKKCIWHLRIYVPAAAVGESGTLTMGTRTWTPEYVTRNDELLAGDARQSLMRNDSVKLDKRVMATWPKWRASVWRGMNGGGVVCHIPVPYAICAVWLTLHSRTTRLDLMKMTSAAETGRVLILPRPKCLGVAADVVATFVTGCTGVNLLQIIMIPFCACGA